MLAASWHIVIVHSFRLHSVRVGYVLYRILVMYRTRAWASRKYLDHIESLLLLSFQLGDLISYRRTRKFKVYSIAMHRICNLQHNFV